MVRFSQDLIPYNLLSYQITAYVLIYLLFLLVLKETLENRGVLGQIRARVRAEVFSALDDQVS